MNIFGILTVWLVALTAIPYTAFFTGNAPSSHLRTADVALNFVLLHGLTKVLSVFIPTYVSAIIEAVLMGAIYYNTVTSGSNTGLSGLYSTGILESFESVSIFFTWLFLVFETWQVAKIAFNLPEMLKRIYEYSSRWHGEDYDGTDNKASYVYVQMNETSSCYTVFEFAVIVASCCLCLISIWFHFVVYGSGSTSLITTVAGYAILVVDVVAVILGFKAKNGMFIGAIFNVFFVSFNLYRGFLSYNSTHKSWKTFFVDTTIELKNFVLMRNQNEGEGADAAVGALQKFGMVAAVVSVLLAAITVILFVAEFLINENSFVESEKDSIEIDKEMAKLDNNYVDFVINCKVRELGIALVQYLIEGVLLVSYAGVVLALNKGLGPGYYMRLLQSVVLLGVFVKRMLDILNEEHDKME